MISLKALNGELTRVIGNDLKFNALVATDPIKININEQLAMYEQHALIRKFFTACLDVFYGALLSGDRYLLDFIFQNVPAHLREEFHMQIPLHLRHSPRFFRTDQAIPGVVTEIQCPGSGWGEHCLLETIFTNRKQEGGINNCLADKVNSDIATIVSGPPIIHHLFDNSSSHISNLYFIQKSRQASPKVSFLGYDPFVAPQDCNFIKTHLFFGLMSENFTNSRLKKAFNKELWYDYPPLAIFEQKLLMALPFEDRYADKFPDSVRDLFPFTSIMKPKGTRLKDGRVLSFEELCELPKRERQFFLKFAGIDPEKNWGSRGVFFAGDFTKNRFRTLLSQIAKEYKNQSGSWILQYSSTQKSDVSFFNHAGEITTDNCYRRLSGFYGPSGLLGCKGLFRSQKKVHGQADTIFGLVTDLKNSCETSHD